MPRVQRAPSEGRVGPARRGPRYDKRCRKFPGHAPQFWSPSTRLLARRGKPRRISHSTQKMTRIHQRRQAPRNRLPVALRHRLSTSYFLSLRAEVAKVKADPASVPDSQWYPAANDAIFATAAHRKLKRLMKRVRSFTESTDGFRHTIRYPKFRMRIGALPTCVRMWRIT